MTIDTQTELPVKTKLVNEIIVSSPELKSAPQRVVDAILRHKNWLFRHRSDYIGDPNEFEEKKD